jgi:hypothetical protein
MNDPHLVKEAHSLHDLPQDLNSLGHGHWGLGAVFNLEELSEVGSSTLQHQATQRRRRKGSRRDAITRGIEEEDVFLAEELGGGVQPVHEVARSLAKTIAVANGFKNRSLLSQLLLISVREGDLQHARDVLTSLLKDSSQDLGLTIS